MEQVKMDRDRLMAELRNTLQSTGWKFYVEPSLRQLLEADRDMLALPLTERGTNPKSDDFLRGRINGVRGVLADFTHHLREHELLKVQLDVMKKAEAEAELGIGTIYGADAVNPREE